MKHSDLVELINAGIHESDADALKMYREHHADTIRQDKEFSVRGDEAIFLHACMGLVTESSELLDLTKKKHYGKKVNYDREKIKDEAGDLFWYFNLLLKSQGLSLEEVLVYNMEKLKKRYSK